MLAYKDNDTWTRWTNQQRPRNGSGAYALPENAETAMSDAELVVYGLHRVAEARPIPDGHRVISTTLGDDGGVPRWIVESERIPFAELQAARLAELANQRWQAEKAGIVVAGVLIMTDRESQALITGAALQAILDAAYSVSWKTADGSFRLLSAAQLLTIARAVRAHVQACFDREAELARAINETSDVAALGKVDIASGWPSAA